MKSTCPRQGSFQRSEFAQCLWAFARALSKYLSKSVSALVDSAALKPGWLAPRLAPWGRGGPGARRAGVLPINAFAIGN